MTDLDYAENKKARHRIQAAHLTTILSLPERAQAVALFGVWPERLPRLVKRKITSDIRTQWRALRETTHDQRWEAYHLAMAKISEDDHREEIRALLLEKHGKAVSDMKVLISSLENLTFMTVAVGQQSIKLDLSGEEDVENEAELALAMAIHMGGAITLRQTLALRTQIKNDNGEMEWVQQERVYGITCGEGQWKATSEADMRMAYNHDQTGRLLPRDQATTFGSLKDQARKLIGRKVH